MFGDGLPFTRVVFLGSGNGCGWTVSLVVRSGFGGVEQCQSCGGFGKESNTWLRRFMTVLFFFDVERV